jgi:hypothetical protein
LTRYRHVGLLLVFFAFLAVHVRCSSRDYPIGPVRRPKKLF